MKWHGTSLRVTLVVIFTPVLAVLALVGAWIAVPVTALLAAVLAPMIVAAMLVRSIVSKYKQATPGFRILIVDNDTSFCKEVIGKLHDDFQTEIESEPHFAVKKILQNAYDLIVLRHRMHHTSSTQIIAALESELQGKTTESVAQPTPVLVWDALHPDHHIQEENQISNSFPILGAIRKESAAVSANFIQSFLFKRFGRVAYNS